MALVPCPSCKRHVRAGDSACPFCASALPEGARALPGAQTRLGRSALFAFAVGVAGCSAATEPVTAGDAGGDTGKSDGAADDSGGGMALYGAPADTGAIDTGADDTGSPAAAYGLPPDAG